MKHAQEVFADAEGRIERATMGQPFVVEETETVIDVGNTEEYDVEFTEEMGLAIGLKKHAASEMTFVHSVPKSLGPESTKKPGHREWKQAKVQIESQLVAINDYPVSSLTHEQVMSRLKKIEWPLRMRFRRPLRSEDVAPDTRIAPIDFVVKRINDSASGGDDDVKLQMLKRLLVAGLKLKKHEKAGGFTDPSFETTLYINEHMIFWERSDLESKVRKVGDVVNKKRKTKFEARESAKSKDSDDYSGVAKFERVDPTKPLFEEKGGAQEKEGLQGNWQLHLSPKYDCTDGMSLYDLKYVRAGKVSSTLKGKSKANEDACFSLFIEGSSRTLDFEYQLASPYRPRRGHPAVEPPESVAKVQEARNLLVWGFNKIITEARGSKLFLDKAGNPSRRVEPKRRLKILTD